MGQKTRLLIIIIFCVIVIQIMPFSALAAEWVWYENIDPDILMSSPVWSHTSVNCNMNLNELVQLNVNRHINAISNAVLQGQYDETIIKIAIFMDEYPIAGYLLTLLVVVSVFFVLIYLFMRKNIRERKQYTNYQKRCIQSLGYSEATLLYYQNPKKSDKAITLSTWVYWIVGIFLIVVFLLSGMINLEGESSRVLIVLTPLGIAIALLLLGLLTAWIIGKIKHNRNIDRSSAEVSPMRVRTVKKGRNKE